MIIKTTGKYVLLPTLIGIGIFLFLFSQSSEFRKPELLVEKYQGYIPEKNPKYDFIIRLHDIEKGFFCSGFVIDDNYAVTAGHCVTSPFNQFMLKRSGIKIVSSKLKNTGIIAHAAAMNPRMDYALIKGDFRKFQKVELQQSRGLQLYPGKQLMSCGWPMGQKELFCSGISFAGTQNSALVGQGLLYPGMSGGPVIDLETGKAIGVNSYVYGGIAAFYPFVGMLAAFGVEP